MCICRKNRTIKPQKHHLALIITKICPMSTISFEMTQENDLFIDGVQRLLKVSPGSTIFKFVALVGIEWIYIHTIYINIYVRLSVCLCRCIDMYRHTHAHAYICMFAFMFWGSCFTVRSWRMEVISSRELVYFS